MSAPSLPKAEVAGEGLTRDDWLEARSTSIGGSEIASVMEVEGAFGSPWTVWLSKTGQGTEMAESEAMHWGTVLEQPIAEEFSNRTGIATFQPEPITIYRNRELSIATASPDRLAIERDAVSGWVEIKNVGAHRSEEWARGVPAKYEAQAQWQLAVSGLPVCYVAVLIGGQDFRCFEVEADHLRHEEMFERAVGFWKLVEAMEPPPVDGSEATKKALAQMYAEADPEPVEGGSELALAVAAYLDASEAAKNAKSVLTRAENAVKLILREHEVGTVEGQPVITWKEQSRESYTVEATTFRKLHVPKAAR